MLIAPGGRIFKFPNLPDPQELEKQTSIGPTANMQLTKYGGKRRGRQKMETNKGGMIERKVTRVCKHISDLQLETRRVTNVQFTCYGQYNVRHASNEGEAEILRASASHEIKRESWGD